MTQKNSSTDFGTTLLIGVAVIGFIFVFKLLGSIEYSRPTGTNYNNSKPVNMSREEWNTAGNIAAENGFSEEEAIEFGDAISRFKANQ